MNAVEPVEGPGRAGVHGLRSGPRSEPRPLRHARQALPWPALLDVLEERTRRLAVIVETGSGELPSDEPLLADGLLPPELSLSAQVLLAETLRLQHLAERRKSAVERQLRYSRT